MRVEYRRETNRNYMIIFPDQQGNSRYSEKMLSENHISGLLLFHAKRIDQLSSYYYDITSKQPLARIMEMRMLRGKEICQMFSDILYTLKRMENFFLDEGQLLLKPEYIYIDPETFHSQICLLPGKTDDFSREFRNLAKDILDHADYTDPEAVMLAFGIFKESEKPNFGLENIERIVRKKENEESGEAEDEEEIPEEKEEVVSRPPVSEAEEKPEIEEKDSPVKMAGKGLLIRIFIFCFMLLLPAGIILTAGTEALSEHKLVLILAELVLTVLMVVSDHGEKERNIEKTTEKTETEERVPKESTDSAEGFFIPFEKEKEVPLTDGEDEKFETVLLTAKGGEKPTCYFSPVREGPEIPVPYTPFIIGKSRELADFCLDRPSVSRLHVRIDLEDGKYYITDLNSTNGTEINHERLMVNEKRELSDGDRIQIAELEYRFFSGENQFR